MKVVIIILSFIIFPIFTSGHADYPRDSKERVLLYEIDVNLPSLFSGFKFQLFIPNGSIFFFYVGVVRSNTGWVVSENSSYSIKQLCEHPPWSKGTFI